MSSFELQTPVVLILFKRPDTTEKVFEAIRQAKPPKLLVIADGSRPDKPGEEEKCAATRAIIDQVDWDCEVLKNYSEINLGCKKRVSSGLNWVFEQVEEAIILEDDCLPDLTFFRFCEELLEYYRHDSRIGVISGTNLQFGHQRTDYSYYFSRYNHCWGWASWRRAWQCFDLEMRLWSVIRDGHWLEDILEDRQAVKFWTEIYQANYDGNINSWAYPWTFCCWTQSLLSILPNVNLISNIGFGNESTNTNPTISKFSNIPTESISFPLKHPPYVIRDTKADHYTQKTHHEISLWRRVQSKYNKTLNKFRKQLQ
ncbi:MAG: glycosyltransferase family 2 protein [Cyanobacteria bacterium J06642_3]